ncbi:hypothetical protein [Mesorhizobium sp. WSM4313]|uniref:hypothetical protein n=1 Tax=Mesorhizobium sp. WSM4313 TaxID=2029412 RepID=UPI000BAE741F|nr:hypothetical protein [Mesorhizobium sp. WSM4313]PBB17847.1 hypothetical protein CK219_22090 [Mesorhizobium sp. WSM4313]
MIRLLSASAVAIVLATSAMAQSSGSGTSGNGSGTATTTGTNGMNNNGNGGTVDPNATNSTTTVPSGGMGDRCKDAAGNDIDNNTASGNTTSNMQNCNK